MRGGQNRCRGLRATKFQLHNKLCSCGIQQASPTPGSQTGIGSWPVRNWATLQEVSDGWAKLPLCKWLYLQPSPVVGSTAWALPPGRSVAAPDSQECEPSCELCMRGIYVVRSIWESHAWWSAVELRCDASAEEWVSGSRSVVSDSLRPHGLYSPRNSPGQDTEVGSLSLLQGIFPTQGSNPGLPHCPWRRALYQLSHKGSPIWGAAANTDYH